MANPPPVICVDGPSGSGKGTLARAIAKKFNWNILDSGALYRTLTFLIDKKEIDIDDFIHKKDEFLRDFEVSFQVGSLGEPVSVFLKEEDITDLVRTEKIAVKTSAFSSLKVIRDFIRPCQRAFKQPPGLIADGRDMGTVIFPEADLKIYLTASLEERAKRREIQLKRLGTKVNMRTLLDELEARDKKDIERDLSPLKPAEDSFLIETTGLSPEEVMEKIRDLLTDL